MTQNAPHQPGTGIDWKGILSIILRLLKKNWGFKLLALCISVVMWSGLITQDPTLTREKVFNDVKISVAGSDAIKRNGMIVVTDLDEILGDAQLRVQVPQMQYGNATASIYNVRVDLSRVSTTGVQDIKVLTTNSATYGTVSEVWPATVQIEVEDYITRYRIPVNVNTVGQVHEGFYAGIAQPDPPMVAVSGPKSLVDRIVQAEAVLKLDSLPKREGTVRTTTEFHLLDEAGNYVESDQLSVTSESVLLDSVVVEQTLYSTKELAMSTLGLTTGQPADGYEIKSVSCTPEVVRAAGRAVNLDLLDTLYVNSAVDVTGATESFQKQIKVRRPTELIYLSADTVTVEVEIGPIIQKKGFTDQKVSIVGLGKGLQAKPSTSGVSMFITGPKLWIQGLRSYHITLQCDVSGLGAGEHTVPILYSIQNDDGQNYSVEIGPANMQITITER